MRAAVIKLTAIMILASLYLVQNALPLASSDYKVVRSGVVTATAYNSLSWQTDASPWITASGTRCREGVIAANFLPFGTKVRIEGFPDRIFVVEDRMHRRHKNRIDIWFRHYKDARKFGVRKVKYYVLDTDFERKL